MTLPQLAFQTPTKIPPKPVTYIELIKPVEAAQFPDRTPAAHEANAYRKEQRRLAAIEAAHAAEEAARQAQQSKTVYMKPNVEYSVRQAVGTLNGSYGYISPLNNCVTLAKQYGKTQPGNPISWSPSTNAPFIGAAALFTFNHVGIVTGIWSNGDIEVAQANYWGHRTRFSQSEIRGYF